MDAKETIALSGVILGFIYFSLQRIWSILEKRRASEKSLIEKDAEIVRLTALLTDFAAKQADAIEVAKRNYRVESKSVSDMSIRERYLNIIIEENTELNIQGLKTQSPIAINLLDVYIPITVTSKRKIELKESAPAEDVNDDFRIETNIDLLQSFPSEVSEELSRDNLSPIDTNNIPFKRRNRYGKKRIFHFANPTSSEGLQNGLRLIIIGGPGSGKSTFIQYASIAFAHGKQLEVFGVKQHLIPIVLKLRSIPVEWFTNQSLASIAFLLSEKKGYAIPLDFFSENLLNGECVIFIDGLDEVPTQYDRNNALEWIKQATSTYFKCSFIITSRPSGYPDHIMKKFNIVNVCPLSFNEIEKFCMQWMSTVETTLRGDTAETRKRISNSTHELTTAIKLSPAINSLSTIPLLLSIICLVHRYRARLPNRRVDLYSECLDVLLEHWDAVKKLQIQFPAHQALQIIQPVALRFHQLNTKSLDACQLKEIIKNSLSKIGINDDSSIVADRFLEAIRDRSGILAGIDMNSYAFAHLTFQEFLSAKEIINTGETQILVDNFENPSWREVILLYSGLIDVSILLKSIIEKKIEAKSSILILDVLSESVSCSPSVRDLAYSLVITHMNDNENELIAEAFLDRLIKDIGSDISKRFLTEIMLVNGSNCASRKAAWKFFRNSTIKRNRPLIAEAIDSEFEFDEVISCEPDTAKAIAKRILEYI